MASYNDSQVTIISKLDLMPNISMIEKVVQQVCTVDYIVSKYTFLLINQSVYRPDFFIEEDISRMKQMSSSKKMYALFSLGMYIGFFKFVR